MKADCGLAAALIAALMTATGASSQSPDKSRAVEDAYVSIVPAGQIDVDAVLGLQRGIGLALCQSGIRHRVEGPEVRPELRLAASLTKADFETDRQNRHMTRECELTEASITLPDGTKLALPDLAISSRTSVAGTARGRNPAEGFFVACGVNFARTALDALKDKVTLRHSSCDALPPPPRAKKASARRQ